MTHCLTAAYGFTRAPTVDRPLVGEARSLAMTLPNTWFVVPPPVPERGFSVLQRARAPLRARGGERGRQPV